MRTLKEFIPIGFSRGVKGSSLICGILLLLPLSGSWGFEPQSNANGVRWESSSAEAWSGSYQTNSSGAVLNTAGAFDSSVDTVNGNGVVAYIGLLDPIGSGGPGDTPTPTMTGTPPTPTETGTPPTVTETPTITPGGPTLTPTSCVVAMDDEDYDLNGDGFIDARDLIGL